jgi:guanylate cyclase soluble subunit beta
MYGWIHGCLEKLVLVSYGEFVWIQIKEEANCNIITGDFIRYESYGDDETMALFTATCKVLNLDIDTILEIFGRYFMEYVREEGYLNMLTVLGSSLREWLTNVNDLHAHLQSSLPQAKFPEYWCVDDEESTPPYESMILHYCSQVLMHTYTHKM